MKKYSFRIQYNCQGIPYLDLQGDEESIWLDKIFFQSLDAVLRKRFENAQDISSIAYFEQNKKKDLNPAEFNHFLAERELTLSLLKTDEHQKKYIFILQWLLVSLATKKLPSITDKTVALAIVNRTKTLYQSLCGAMSSEITLNKAFLGGASLHFSLPTAVHKELLFPNNAAVVVTSRSRVRPELDLDTENLSSMCTEWSEASEAFQPECAASTSGVPILGVVVQPASPTRLAQATQVVPVTLNTQPSFFRQQEVTAQHAESQAKEAKAKKIEEKVQKLVSIHQLYIEKLITPFEFANSKSANGKKLPELSLKGSIGTIIVHIIKHGLTLKEEKFQVDKLDEAIEQLKKTFEAEDMEEDCEQIKQIYTLLGIAVKRPFAPAPH